MIPDIFCFSHLRWNFVYQRPQHLMTRFASGSRVFFIEEPIFDGPWNRFEVMRPPETGVTVLVPHLLSGYAPEEVDPQLNKMLLEFMDANHIVDFVSWYYSPMALGYTDSLAPVINVYDCMDELSNFKFAPPALKEREAKLFQIADVVFTGGHTLYEAKKLHHNNIFAFPSSIDKQHFLEARKAIAEPVDQQLIPHPRFGFYGVLDERLDIDLIRAIAGLRPDWHIILIGPVVKIDESTLPRAANIHYLGGKDYKQLPGYLSGWDVAIMPFALNDSTRFISPTKTPEYLAGGKPVISSSISDVVNDYAQYGLVSIADSAEEFIEEGEVLLENKERSKWLQRVDIHLENNSWDNTWRQMTALIGEAIVNKKVSTLKNLKYV